MDALSFLRADHESVLGLLELLEGVPSEAGHGGVASLVANLVIAESEHEAVEQQWFWPAVRRILDNGDVLADHAIAQEQAGKRLLQRLLDGKPGQQDYHQALAEFVKAGREHIAFEQEVVWPAFAAAAGPAELERLGHRLAVAKKVATTRPHPGTPPNALVQKTVGTAAAVVDRLRDAATGRVRDYPPPPLRG